MRLWLQIDPVQARWDVERGARAEAVGETINEQVARFRPALFLVEQHADTGIAEIDDRTVLKLDIAPIQEGAAHTWCEKAVTVARRAEESRVVNHQTGFYRGE